MPLVKNVVLQVVDVATSWASPICCEPLPHDVLRVIATLVTDLLPLVVAVLALVAVLRLLAVGEIPLDRARALQQMVEVRETLLTSPTGHAEKLHHGLALIDGISTRGAPMDQNLVVLALAVLALVAGLRLLAVVLRLLAVVLRFIAVVLVLLASVRVLPRPEFHQQLDHGVFWHGLVVGFVAPPPSVLEQVVLGHLLEVIAGRFEGDDVVVEVDGAECLCTVDLIKLKLFWVVDEVFQYLFIKASTLCKMDWPSFFTKNSTIAPRLGMPLLFNSLLS